MSYRGWESFVPLTRAELRAQAGRPPTPSKYHAVKTTTADGIVCDSKIEAVRWAELKAMQYAGRITDLMPHPSFPVFVNGTRVGRFTFDAIYVEVETVDTTARTVIEDTKSRITSEHTAYRARLKTFKACYPHIRVNEVIR